MINKESEKFGQPLDEMNEVSFNIRFPSDLNDWCKTEADKRGKGYSKNLLIRTIVENARQNVSPSIENTTLVTLEQKMDEILRELREVKQLQQLQK